MAVGVELPSGLASYGDVVTALKVDLFQGCAGGGLGVWVFRVSDCFFGGAWVGSGSGFPQS